eukprot:scaffold18324_cov176-Amphora_coffeaeformis.AAC.15
MATDLAAELAEIDDFNVVQSVCSGNWDDIAEDYVDGAGRACLEAIVATPPTLALHEVTLDPVGVVGIQVNRPRCRDHTGHPLSLGPPSDICMVVSFLRDGEVFATTPLSRPLRSAKPGGDDFSVVSDISSLSAVSAKVMDASHGSRDDSPVVNIPIQQIVGVWGKTIKGSREMVTFDSCFELSSKGEASTNIDVVAYLVDTNAENAEETVSGVPLAIGALRIEGNGSEKRMVCDIPLHEPLSKESYPFLQLPNPNYVAGQLGQILGQRPAETAGEKSKTSSKKKKKGFAKLFSGRKKMNDDEEKKSEYDDDADGDDDSIGLCNPLSSFINDAYILDQVQGAFLRFKVEWKEKETNFEVNLQNRLPSLLKENSVKEPTNPEDRPEDTMQASTEESLETSEQAKNQKNGIPERPGKTCAGLNSVNSLSTATTVTPKAAKKSKGKSFFFNKKKPKDEKTPARVLPESSEMVVSTLEKRLPIPEPDQKAHKAAVLLEIRERSLGVRDAEQVNKVERMSPPMAGINTARKENEEANEDETVTSMLDTMYNAVVGQAKEEGSDKGVETEANSISSASRISQKSSNSSKIDLAPSGAALSPVLSGTPIQDGSTANMLQEETENEKTETGKDAIVDISPHNSIELTPNNGLYTQFVQAASTLLQGTPHVEFKKIDANLSQQEPMPALEIHPSPDRLGKYEKQTPRRQSGPVDIDAVDDGEIGMSDDEAALLAPVAQRLRVSTPSPQDLSMERILSWDYKRFEEHKSQRVGFGRKRRGYSTSESVPSASLRYINTKVLPSTPTSQIDASSERSQKGRRSSRKSTDIDSIESKYSMKAPSTSPRNPRESSILHKNDRRKKERREISNSATPSERDTTNSLKKIPKRRNLFGKLFRSKSTSSLVSVGNNGTRPRLDTSAASVLSDADTAGIDNVAKASVIAALRKGKENNENSAAAPNSDTDRSETESPAFSEKDVKNQLIKPDFSLLNMCGQLDADYDPMKVDDKEAWLYAKDDETYFTKETPQQEVGDDLTLIPSPADLFLSETYHRCGPGRIADLGDAIIEETQHLVSKSGLLYLRDKSDAETFGTLTFDEPTFDPSILSGDAKSASVESRTQSARSGRVRSPTPTSRPKVNYSPKGVAEFNGKGEQSKIESFSEAFVNFITCRSPGHNTMDHRPIPSELIRNDDNGSLGDLTLTTYEMQVEIEQYKKKIEQLRSQAENLDENGDVVGDDAVLVFQPPSVDRRTGFMPSTGDH